MRHEEFSARLHEATWRSEEPFAAQSRLLEELAAHDERTSLSGSLQFGQLSLRLRDRRRMDESRSILLQWASNPWSACQIAEIDAVTNNSSQAVARLASISGAHEDLPSALAVRVLRLASQLDLDLFDRIGASLRDPGALDMVMYPIRAGSAVDRAPLERYASVLAERVPINLDAAHDVVNVTASIPSGSNPHVEWSDTEAVSAEWLLGLLNRVADAKANAQGFSLIRLFDGEAEFLTGNRRDLAGAAGLLADGSHRTLTDPEHDLLHDAVHDAIEHATICVVPDLGQIIYGPVRSFGVARWLLDHPTLRSNLIAGPLHLGWAVEAHGLTPQFIALATGVIGPANPEHCTPLAGRGLKWLRIPGEAHFFAREPSGESHFHDYFDSIRRYPFVPGEVWLVAAGILGKAYCESIRASGAVAIDVGAVMDLWAGRGDTRQAVRLYPWLARPYLT